MCGRYFQQRGPASVARYFETVNPLPNFAASWNRAPTQDAMVVRRHPETGLRHLDRAALGAGAALGQGCLAAPRR